MAAAATNGSARRSGSPPISARAGPIRARAWPIGEGETPIRSAWSIAASGDTVYAGVEPAGLFRSDDRGQSWRHVAGLRDHPSRPEWQPGGGGLILHSLVTHPDDPEQLWVAISTGGVFHTGDGGLTWEARNRGTRCDFLPEEQRYPETGQCVHHLTMAPGMPDRLYQQNHCGMYRSEDGGRRWESIEAGLPSTFGFPGHDPSPRSRHPLPPAAQRRFGRPLPARGQHRRLADPRRRPDLERPAGRAAAAGRLLRRAAPGHGDRPRWSPPGVYFGTNTGSLFASSDEGESWACVAQHLPTILSVETLVVDG